MTLYCLSVVHEFVYVIGCFDNGITEVQIEFDGEEVLYVDFERQEIVYTVPLFLVLDPREMFGDIGVYKDARKAKNTCSAVIAYCKAKEKDPPEERGKLCTILL